MLRMTGKRILVELDRPREESSGGIFIPPVAQQSETQGKVLSIGEGVEDVKEGDIVLFSKYSGTDITYAGKELKILHMDFVTALLETK